MAREGSITTPQGYLAHDPSSAYELPAAESRRIDVLDPAALRHLYDDPEHGSIWRFYVETALRARELTWLLREDVIRDAAGRPTAIHVRAKGCPFTGMTWRPKHGLERVVPLTVAAAAIAEGALVVAA